MNKEAIIDIEKPKDNDLISRQAVFKIQAKYAEYIGATKFWQMSDDIKALPPVNPQEPKAGHWISHYDEDAKEGWYECNRCHTERAFNTDFCPDCGARMVEPQERSEKG